MFDDETPFATTSNPFLSNAVLAFDEHCRLSLIHSPDPQVKPGREPRGTTRW